MNINRALVLVDSDKGKKKKKALRSGRQGKREKEKKIRYAGAYVRKEKEKKKKMPFLDPRGGKGEEGGPAS